MSRLADIITASEPAVRNRSVDDVCAGASADELLREESALEALTGHDNLYVRVRALFFLYAIHRFHLPGKLASTGQALIPFQGYEHLLNRRFAQAIRRFREVQGERGPSDGLSSALAAAYRGLAFDTLAAQVRRSVRSVRGNQWMFRVGTGAELPLRIRPELLQPGTVLHETTPVRMDLSHSAWSDIFFLGMDFPEGAKVLNVSVDLAVRSHGAQPKPPVEAYFRVIDRPVLRLVSCDLNASAEIDDVNALFDFGRDYLGLLKAAVIASGIVPSAAEGSGQPLASFLSALTGSSSLGVEVISRVNGIPKGSRLAVSTNLLACLISACMRATGQARSLTGPLAEDERRIVAARAILGEWLGGSGGGWQDSGGVWPGIKLIEGVEAAEGDAEFAVSRGRLLPRHHVFNDAEISARAREQLEQSLVLVHGGMAQDVGPILEMVTERYLLRSPAEWTARLEALDLLRDVLEALAAGDVPALGRTTERNFRGPIQTIIPWASNYYTETLIRRVRDEFGADFHGFWMLGGMSGGGMGFMFEPSRRSEAQERLQTIMGATSRELRNAVPFAITPVVYEFAINDRGTYAALLEGADALLPPEWYNLMAPQLLRKEQIALTRGERADLEQFGAACRDTAAHPDIAAGFLDRLLPAPQQAAGTAANSLAALLEEHGFDRVQHERIRADLRRGALGLAQNRLPVTTRIEDAGEGDVQATNPEYAADGEAAIREGRVAVVTLAGGAGSRWTHGAGVVKALNPFWKTGGVHRSFLEVHLAKSRATNRRYGVQLPHIVTTSYLTGEPIAEYLRGCDNYGYDGPVLLSAGKAVGLRFVPMPRDLRFAWEEMPQQVLEDRAQRMRDSVRAALIGWAQSAGPGSDYTDNLPLQCMHPVGHWFEIPNLIRNGVLRNLLAQQPQVEHLMVHNVDTMGAAVDAAVFGVHLRSGATMTTEVIRRRMEDRGGGLARVNGALRLVEGLALPKEEIEFDLTWYNTNTCWIAIDPLLGFFGLSRADLADEAKTTRAVRELAARMPTYIAIKDAKKRWGRGQEDVYPVAQWEKLWVDMTALSEMRCSYIGVPRARGQQLKEPAQLDGWLRDGSAAYVEGLCCFQA